MKGQGSIVEFQFLKGAGQIFVLVGGDGVERRKHDLLHFLEPGQRGRAWAVLVGDGVARAGIGDGLNAGNDVTDLARGQLRLRFTTQAKDAQFLDAIFCPIGHKYDLVTGLDRSIDDPNRDNCTAVRIIISVKDKRFKRFGRISLGRRQQSHHSIEQFLHTLPGFSGTHLDGCTIQTEIFFDLSRHPFRFSCRQVDFVDDRNDLQIVFHGQIQVGQGLRLNPLGCIDQEQCAFAGGKGAGNLITEINMTWGINEVQRVGFAVIGLERQADSLRFDGNATLPFYIHGIEHLILKFAISHNLAELNHPVGQGGFAVINMGNNAKISNILHGARKDWRIKKKAELRRLSLAQFAGK